MPFFVRWLITSKHTTSSCVLTQSGGRMRRDFRPIIKNCYYQQGDRANYFVSTPPALENCVRLISKITLTISAAVLHVAHRNSESRLDRIFLAKRFACMAGVRADQGRGEGPDHQVSIHSLLLWPPLDLLMFSPMPLLCCNHSRQDQYGWTWQALCPIRISVSSGRGASSYMPITPLFPSSMGLQTWAHFLYSFDALK